MDRRLFLKTSALGAVAVSTLGAGSLVSSCAKPASKSVPLHISFQQKIAPGETLAEKFDYMEALGIEGFEPGGKDLAQRVPLIREALRGRSIKVSAICAGFGGFILAEDPEQKALFDSSMREIVRAAGELESTGVIMVPAFNRQQPCRPNNKETWDFLCEELRALGDYALEQGTTVILEPLNRKEAFYLRHVALASAIARDSGSAGVKVMGDFWHMQEETSDYAALMAAGPEFLQHVHIASRATRHMPGEDGDADNYIDGFRALKEMGYKNYVSFECGLAGDDRDAAVRAAVQLMRDQWEQA